MLVWALWIEDSLRWQVAGGLLKNQTVQEGARIPRGVLFSSIEEIQERIVLVASCY